MCIKSESSPFNEESPSVPITSTIPRRMHARTFISSFYANFERQQAVQPVLKSTSLLFHQRSTIDNEQQPWRLPRRRMLLLAEEQLEERNGSNKHHHRVQQHPVHPDHRHRNHQARRRVNILQRHSILKARIRRPRPQHPPEQVLQISQSQRSHIPCMPLLRLPRLPKQTLLGLRSFPSRTTTPNH